MDCGYTLEPPSRGGSNEYPQSMLWIRNKKKLIPLYTPVLIYYYIKVGYRGNTLYGHHRDATQCTQIITRRMKNAEQDDPALSQQGSHSVKIVQHKGGERGQIATQINRQHKLTSLTLFSDCMSTD